MKALIVTVLFSLCMGIVCADMILMSPEEEELRGRFAASPTQEEVVEAFNSRHYILHQKAIEWMILMRDTKTWANLRNQRSKLKEISLQLYPILDFLASRPADTDKPLIQVLKEEHLKMLVRKGEDLPPRHEYSYVEPPVDEVLYVLLAKDLERVSASRQQVIEAARLLLQYRAPSKTLEKSVELKASLGKDEPNLKKVSIPTDQEFAPAERFKGMNNETSISKTNQFLHRLTYLKIIAITLACLGIVAFLLVLRRARI